MLFNDSLEQVALLVVHHTLRKARPAAGRRGEACVKDDPRKPRVRRRRARARGTRCCYGTQILCKLLCGGLRFPGQ